MRTIEPLAHLLRYRRLNDRGCWEWTGATTSAGYGKIKSRGRTRNTHRFAWEVFTGVIPDGQMVLHRCDNKICFNPDHLFLGSHKENMADMRQKGRSFRPAGEAHNLAKLTADQVREVRAAAGLQREIAARFGISRTNVSLIRSGKTWTHIEVAS